MQIGDLAMLRADRSDFYNSTSIRPTPNDVVLIEDFSFFDGEIVVYVSTHTGVRDWMRADNFARTFKIIITNKKNKENDENN